MTSLAQASDIYVMPEHPSERGGLARLATLINQQRAAHPDSVLMNVGDTFHGGAEALFTLGNAIVDPVNALGIDVGVPGNWDFGYSSVVFRLRYTDEPQAGIFGRADPLTPKFDVIKKPNFPNLAANLTHSIDGSLVLPATLHITAVPLPCIEIR